MREAKCRPTLTFHLVPWLRDDRVSILVSARISFILYKRYRWRAWLSHFNGRRPAPQEEVADVMPHVYHVDSR